MRVRYSFSSRRTRTIDSHSNHRSEFPQLVREMVDKCDIILEILDARFIQETRNLRLESMIKQKDKKIIYVLNKADLANPNEAKKKLEILGLSPFVFVSARERIGIGDLRERIKIETKKLEGKYPKINIGVVGYPNTGKSSVINMLVGRSVARTASEAGFTKGIQKIKLARNLYILDTPGVIPQEKYSMQDDKKIAEHAKLSARNYDKIKEPDFVVHELMKQYPGVLEKFYNIDAKGDSELLIEKLARNKKFILKGNIVDIDRTARFVLREWQEGKISI